MTVEEINGEYDNFPVGMRVLAVDDDLICLKVLERLLRECQYEVTTINQARVALKMLREHKDRYDLVISDVHMPDMDGFKLLEFVGLEMDLPVIMLSANSDPKLVMKGVTHGACDYLVKPVRIEELRNIWQHVLRRKKFDPKHHQKSPDQDKSREGNAEGGQGPSMAENTDQSGKLNKKRKEDEDEDEENGHDNEDPAAQKKPRVVWSIELHRKFVAAVNQLGIEKAVPKRILDLMNVEGLSRENVASHLQKYRLYLKRISSVATQQANIYAALGSKDPTYMRMGSLDGLGDFRTFAGSGRIANTVLSPYSPGGMLGRLNSPAGISLHNLTSSTLIPVSHAQNFSNSINNLGKFQPVASPASQNANLIQGTPSLDLDQLHQTDNLRNFSHDSAFTDTRSSVVCPISSLCTPSSSMMLPENCPGLNGGGLGSQSSLNVHSFNPDSYNGNWQIPTQLLKFQSNTASLTEPLSHGNVPLNYVRDNPSSAVPDLLNPLDSSATTTASSLVENARYGLHCQEGLVGDGVPSMNQSQNESWGDNGLNYTHNSDNIFSTLNCQVPANRGSQSIDQNNVIFSRKMDASLGGRQNGGASMFFQHEEFEKSTMDRRTMSSGGNLFGQMKPHAAVGPHSYDSLDDLMNTMTKREQDGTMSGGEFAFNAYSFGSCM